MVVLMYFSVILFTSDIRILPLENNLSALFISMQQSIGNEMFKRSGVNDCSTAWFRTSNPQCVIGSYAIL